MISATSASNTTSIAQLNTGIDISELTPEGVLAYCAERMGNIDSQVKEYMSLANKRQHAREALSDLETTLKTHGNGLIADPNDQPKKDIVAKYNAAIEATKDADPQLAQRLTEERDKFQVDAFGHDGITRWQFGAHEGAALAYEQTNAVGKESMEKMAEAVDAISGDLDQKSQLDMMTLQSLMSKRQTAVQMCTNLVSSLGDTSKAIAANVGK